MINPDLERAYRTRDRIERQLVDFEIGDPLKALFNPSIAPRVIGHTVSMVLTFQVPDCKGGGVMTFSFGRHCPSETCLNKEKLYQFLRQMIHNMVIHEADESIRVNGKRIFNPHPDEE